MKILSRVGISIIINRHLQTFYNYGLYEWQGKKKVPKSDLFTFIFLPAAIALTIAFLDPLIINNSSELIVTSLSIFVGLLFSLLTLVFDLAKKTKEKYLLDTENDHKLKATFVLTKELFVNIAYSIALSIVCIAFVFIMKFRPILIVERLKLLKNYAAIKEVYVFLMDSIIMFLLIQFSLTLLMILKRFFIVFNKEIETNK